MAATAAAPPRLAMKTLRSISIDFSLKNVYSRDDTPLPTVGSSTFQLVTDRHALYARHSSERLNLGSRGSRGSRDSRGSPGSHGSLGSRGSRGSMGSRVRWFAREPQNSRTHRTSRTARTQR